MQVKLTRSTCKCIVLDMKLEAVRSTASLLGDKWTPQLICAVAQSGSIRFCRLQEEVGGINPRTLTSKLNLLEESGVIEKLSQERYHLYSLTARGQDLLPVIKAMSQWSERHSAI